jgi:hypothetical protein
MSAISPNSCTKPATEASMEAGEIVANREISLAFDLAEVLELIRNGKRAKQ